MGVEFYKEIKLVSIKSIGYFEYFQWIKLFIELSFGVFFFKYWTAKVMLKNVFYSLKSTNIVANTFKSECNECDI